MCLCKATETYPVACDCDFFVSTWEIGFGPRDSRNTEVLRYPGIGVLPNSCNETCAGFANIDTAAVITYKHIVPAPLVVRNPVLKVDQEFAIDVEVIVRGSRIIRTKDAVRGARQTAKIRKLKSSQFLTGGGLARYQCGLVETVPS